MARSPPADFRQEDTHRAHRHRHHPFSRPTSRCRSTPSARCWPGTTSSRPSLKVADAAAASVFGAARLRGPIARDAIAQVTGLSIATVNRQVTALLGRR